MVMNKSTKIIVLLILIFICLFLIILNIFSNYQFKAIRVYEKNVDQIIYRLEEIEPEKLNIKLDGNVTYYNELENIYYYYIDELYYKKCLDLELNIYSKTKYNYIIDYKYSEKAGLCVDYNNPITIFLYNDKDYFDAKIQFTSVPIMNINVAQIGYFGDEANLQFYGSIDGKTSYIESNAMINLRGATSLNYPKKQYRLSLFKGKNKNEISFLDMEKDEDWILDAMYSDYSKIRSKLSFDLWNEINSYTHNKIDNDIELKYIDIYINNNYEGLYLLKEVVDRKLLNLDETSATNSGILIKGNTFDSINLAEYETNKRGTIVLPFELKYPNNAPDYSRYWDNIIDRIYKYYFDTSKITDEYVLDTFNANNFVDYKIFSNVIAALDNMGHKNVFFSTKDMNSKTKVIITPWDLDMTFGYYWDNNPTTLLGSNYLTYELPYTILQNSDYINKLIIDRYFELRESILSIEHVNSLIDSYYNKIKYSVIKDSERWLETNLEKEINDIKIWYKKRVEYLDKYLGEYYV